VSQASDAGNAANNPIWQLWGRQPETASYINVSAVAAFARILALYVLRDEYV
jgi:hypothetical protein